MLACAYIRGYKDQNLVCTLQEILKVSSSFTPLNFQMCTAFTVILSSIHYTRLLTLDVLLAPQVLGQKVFQIFQGHVHWPEVQVAIHQILFLFPSSQAFHISKVKTSTIY